MRKYSIAILMLIFIISYNLFVPRVRENARIDIRAIYYDIFSDIPSSKERKRIFDTEADKLNITEFQEESRKFAAFNKYAAPYQISFEYPNAGAHRDELKNLLMPKFKSNGWLYYKESPSDEYYYKLKPAKNQYFEMVFKKNNYYCMVHGSKYGFALFFTFEKP